jgi:O-antigen/teichoic acid export membrane protein
VAVQVRSGAEARREGGVLPPLGQHLLSGLLWTAATRIALVVVSLVTNMLLARLLTPDELGTYVLLFSAALVAMLVGMIGQQGAVVRFVSEALAAGRTGEARRAAESSVRMTTAGVIVTVVLLVALATLLPPTIRRAPMLAVVFVGVCAIALGIVNVLAEAFRGLRAYGLASVLGPNTYGVILVLALAVLHLAPTPDHLVGVLGICACAALASLGITGAAFRRRMHALGPAALGRTPGMASVGWPLMLGYLAMFASSQADLWVLGGFRSREEVAAYASAARVVQQLLAPLLVMGAVVAPLIAELRSAGDTVRLERLLRRAALVDLAPALIGLGAAVIVGADLLALVFGASYRAGAAPLAVLCTGLVLLALSGPALTMLAMAGGQREVMLICVASLAFQLAGGVLVVERFGSTGVALITACGMALQGLLAMLAVRRRWGLWSSPLAPVRERRQAVRVPVTREPLT